MQETQVRSLGWEDPLEKETAPTPVFLPGESHGQRSLAGYSPRGRKESDTTERLHFLSFLPLWEFRFVPLFTVTNIAAKEFHPLQKT